jgi:hypothetical protein
LVFLVWKYTIWQPWFAAVSGKPQSFHPSLENSFLFKKSSNSKKSHDSDVYLLKSNSRRKTAITIFHHYLLRKISSEVSTLLNILNTLATIFKTSYTTDRSTRDWLIFSSSMLLKVLVDQVLLIDHTIARSEIVYLVESKIALKYLKTHSGT